MEGNEGRNVFQHSFLENLKIYSYQVLQENVRELYSINVKQVF